MTRRAIIREADLRRLVKVVVEQVPGARMTIDLAQNQLHFVLSNTPPVIAEDPSTDPLDWLLNGNDTQTGAPKD